MRVKTAVSQKKCPKPWLLSVISSRGECHDLINLLDRYSTELMSSALYFCYRCLFYGFCIIESVQEHVRFPRNQCCHTKYWLCLTCDCTVLYEDKSLINSVCNHIPDVKMSVLLLCHRMKYLNTTVSLFHCLEFGLTCKKTCFGSPRKVCSFQNCIKISIKISPCDGFSQADTHISQMWCIKHRGSKGFFLSSTLLIC